jgi:integrase
MATIELRTNEDESTSYRVKVRLKGFKPVYATFNRLTDAKRWAQQTEVAIREGRYFKTAEAKRHTLADLIDRYISDVLPTKPKNASNQNTQLLWWKKQIGHVVLSDLSAALIGEYRDVLAKELIPPKAQTTAKPRYRGPATQVRYLAALSHACSIAQREWGWLEDNPCRKVRKPKEPRGRVRFLSDDERDRLLKVCKETEHTHLYSIVVLALSTGMRSSEIMNLKLPDVDLKRGMVTLHDTKNGERRSVPLTNLALELITKLGKVRRLDTQLLFHSPTKPKQPVEIRPTWYRAMKKADIADFRFHDLRHSAASYLAMNGATTPEIAEVLGHKTLHMVKRYAHLSESHTHSVVASMNEKIFKEVVNG